MTPSPVSRREAFLFWLKLGFVSFGGPAGQIAIMHAELVERRRWISEQRFLHALNYCMLLPGPEAQQLATYIGWLMHRTWGGVVAGGLFVLPSLFMLVGLSWVYIAYGDVAWVAGIFYGIKPAVTALVLHAAHRIGNQHAVQCQPILGRLRVVSGGEPEFLQRGIEQVASIVAGKGPSCPVGTMLARREPDDPQPTTEPSVNKAMLVDLCKITHSTQ